MANVLLVEDHADTADPIAHALRRAGHRVVVVPDGREALAVVMASTPDVILLDLLMPNMDGTTFLSIIRNYLRLADVPVLIVTALARGAELERAMDYGVTKVFRKGDFDLSEITDAVKAATAVN